MMFASMQRRLLGGALCLAVMSAESQGADTRTADAWLDHGLAVAASSLQVQSLGGEFESDEEVAVDSSGKRIAYVKLTPDIKGNVNKVDLWLLDRRHPELARPVTHSTPGAAAYLRFCPQFSPDGKQLAYFAHDAVPAHPGKSDWSSSAPAGDTIAIRRIADGALRSIESSKIPNKVLAAGVVAAGFLSFAWSPDGARLGIIVSGHLERKVEKGIEVSVKGGISSYWLDPNARPARLVILDLRTGKWSAASPEGTDVTAFDWSPQGEQITFSGSIAPDNVVLSYKYTDLFITDLRSGRTRQILAQPGSDSDPLWSPDGRWIAFSSQKGTIRWLNGTRVGLYNVATGGVSYPAFEEIGRVSGFEARALRWAPDSLSLLFRLPYQMSQQLFTLSVPGGTLRRVTRDEDRNFYAAHYIEGGKSIVFLSESFLQPPELYVASAADFRPQRLTDSNPHVDLPRVELRKLSWPSKDGKWTVHGWLLLPEAPAKHGALPLLVYAEGGPGMVAPVFRIGGYQYPVHAFLANGVAVLVPNSRGRAGYGTDFEVAWETEKDYGQGPLEDDLGGVDQLVQAGIADPDRVALAGHSWGGYLAAYALTHTSRFKAILVHEAVSLDSLAEGLMVAGVPSNRDFATQLGKGVPFTDAEAARLKNLSPVYEVEHSTTPALLEFGADSLIKQGNMLFQGLKYFNKAAVELINYPRTGHVIEEPALRYDAARRDLEWFSCWVLGMPTRRMLEHYGSSATAVSAPGPAPTHDPGRL